MNVMIFWQLVRRQVKQVAEIRNGVDFDYDAYFDATGKFDSCDAAPGTMQSALFAGAVMDHVIKLNFCQVEFKSCVTNVVPEE